MIIFLIKSGFCLICFFIFYKWKLEGEVMFRFNRFYLLASLLASFFIPIITIDQHITDLSYLHNINPIGFVINDTTNIAPQTNYKNIQAFLWAIYLIVTFTFLIRICSNIADILKIINSKKPIPLEHGHLILLDDNIVPFAFLNYIFINKKEYEKQGTRHILLLHEAAHVRQKHTYDLIFMEILTALNWFNPLIYQYKKAIKLNHEFLADEAVLKKRINLTAYQNLLLRKSSKNSNLLYKLSNTFNFELTKKRLKMMSKKTSLFNFSSNLFYAALTFLACIILFNKSAIAQERGATKAELKEYIDLISNKMDQDGNINQIKMSEAERMFNLYGKLDEKQRKKLKDMNIPAPPPPPPLLTPAPPPSPPTPPPHPPEAPDFDLKMGSIVPPPPPHASPPPPPPPFPADGKYFINGKKSTLKEANKIIKSGKGYKVKKHKQEFHIKTGTQ